MAVVVFSPSEASNSLMATAFTSMGTTWASRKAVIGWGGRSRIRVLAKGLHATTLHEPLLGACFVAYS